MFWSCSVLSWIGSKSRQAIILFFLSPPNRRIFPDFSSILGVRSFAPTPLGNRIFRFRSRVPPTCSGGRSVIASELCRCHPRAFYCIAVSPKTNFFPTRKIRGGGGRGCQIDMQTEKERQKERNVGVERTEKQKFTQAVWFLRDVLLAAVVVATPLTEVVSWLSKEKFQQFPSSSEDLSRTESKNWISCLKTLSARHILVICNKSLVRTVFPVSNHQTNSNLIHFIKTIARSISYPP